MKKTLFLLLLLAVALVAQAAKDPFKTLRQNIGVGLKITADTPLYLQSIGKMPDGVVSFGYYVMDSKYNAIAGAGGIIDADKLAAGNGLIGEFKEGQVVGFWAKTEDGKYYDSINAHEDLKGDDRNAAYIDGNGNKDSISAVIGSGGFGNGYSPVPEDTAGQTGGLIFDIGSTPGDLKPDGGNTPNGQPLPGALLCFGIGGAAWLYLKKRQAKRIASC